MRQWLCLALCALVLLPLSAAAQGDDPGHAGGSEDISVDGADDANDAVGTDGAGGRNAEPAQVIVSLSPEETTVGGRVQAEITVVWMGETPKEEMRFPTWQENWGGAEVLAVSEVETFEDQSGRHVARQVLELASFETGDVSLPARTFAVPLAERTVELESEPTRFVIASVLPPEAGDEDGQNSQPAGPAGAGPAGTATPQAGSSGATELEPRGHAPPAQLEAHRALFFGSVAGLVFLLFAGLEMLRRRLARDLSGLGAEPSEADALMALEPLDELLARLDALDPLHGGAAHTGVSLALRRYLGRRLGFNAVESTTTEIQRRLLELTSGFSAQITPQEAQRSLELLRACDLVKFAGLDADAPTVRGRIAETRDIGQTVEKAFERATQPSEEAA